jgi:hypothetical protein
MLQYSMQLPQTDFKDSWYTENPGISAQLTNFSLFSKLEAGRLSSFLRF